MRNFKGPRRQGGWVQAAIAVAGAGSSLLTGSKGDKAARKAGKVQALTIWSSYLEEKRRKDIQDQQRMGLGRATVGASNIQQSGSSARYLTAMQDEIDKENRWLKKQAQVAVLAARKGGSAAGRQVRMQGYGQALSFGGKAVSSGYEWATGATNWAGATT